MIGLAAVSVEVAHSWLANLAQAATGSLVAAVWQGMLLTAAAGLGLRLLPKTPAAVRFAIWFGVFSDGRGVAGDFVVAPCGNCGRTERMDRGG